MLLAHTRPFNYSAGVAVAEVSGGATMIQGTDDLSAVWERAERERAFWKTDRADLTRRYPDQFVAVIDERVIATDADLLVLTERLRTEGHDIRDAWIAFMGSGRHPLLL